MNTVRHLIAAAALLALAAQAQAAQYTGFSSAGAGNSVDASFASASELFFDLDFASNAPISLNFVVEAQDLASPLAFNALLRNLSGLGFPGLTATLSGNASFAAPAGTVGTDGFQSVTGTGSSANQLWASFGTPGLTTEAYIGNPLGTPGALDWRVNLAAAQPGDVFSITVAVPEPQTYALMLGGLLAVAAVARRRRRD